MRFRSHIVPVLVDIAFWWSARHVRSDRSDVDVCTISPFRKSPIVFRSRHAVHPLLTDLPPKTVSRLRVGGGLGNRGPSTSKSAESVSQRRTSFSTSKLLGESASTWLGILIHPLESVRTELLHTCRFEEQGLVWVTVDEFR